MDKVLIAVAFFLLGCANNKKDNHKLMIETNQKGDTIFKTPYYLNSKGDTLVDGVVVSYYEHHAVEDSFKMSNGFKSGFYYQFDSLGHLVGKSYFNKNKREGLSFSFFPNGKPEIEELYRKDTLLYSKNYFMNGQLKSYLIFVDKQRTGYYLIYDSLGKKIDESGDSNRVKKW